MISKSKVMKMKKDRILGMISSNSILSIEKIKHVKRERRKKSKEILVYFLNPALGFYIHPELHLIDSPWG